MPQITGTSGNDDLTGTPGDDQINGLAGADHMAGLAGNDIYYVDDAGDVIIELNGEGNDIVYASVGYTLNAGAYIELLTTPSIASTNPIDMTGNELDNTIWGNNGANTLSGGVGGHDTLVGFLGNDIYLINNTDEVVVENAGEGADIVYVNSSYTLSANASIELLSTYSIAGTQAYDLTGNNLDNTIWGNRGNNTLSGGFGGHDTLVGFLGNDIYIVNNTDEVIVENDGEGADIVYVNSSYTLSANASIELLSTFSIAGTQPYNMTGNNLSNTIWGNRGDNTLSGGFGGHDTLVGFLGNDIYLVNNGDEVISELAGEGTDIVYASVNYVLSAGASIELLSTNSIGGTAAINLTGNELDNTIWGNAGGNILNGGNGGVDTLVGGDGDDTYIVDSNDIVIEAGGPGTGILDRVLATANYTIAAGEHVESLGVFDPATQTSFTLVGNDFTQEIRGGAGGDVLIGHRGGTTFYGGLGADTLNGSGTINNFYVFDTALGAGNVDTIVQFSSGTDRIVLYARADEPFAALAAGQINSGLIRFGTAAVDADDMLIYDQATGTLSYDADGNGAGAAVQFAKLAAGTAIGPDSFFINAEYPDHAPTISSAANVSVNENVPANTIVYQVAASDADGDRIFYSLTGVDGDRFTVDANGTVRLIASPNFEAKPSYSFTVVASDTAASTSKAVVLTIVDLPENGGSTPIINEIAAANDSLGSAQAIDRGLFEIASNPNLPDPSLPSATIQGRIQSFADGDYYRITLNAGELLILDVDGTTEGLDSHIFLYDSTGKLLIDNDDLVTPDPGSGIQFDHNTDSFLRVRAPTTGTYYFKIESFQDQSNPSLGNYQINVSIGPVGTQAQIDNENIDALISGDFWNHKNLSYGFPQLPGQYPNDAQGHAFPETLNNFGGFNPAQISATQSLLQMIANVTQLVFAIEPNQPGQADLRYAMSDEADVAYAYYPTNEGPSSVGGTTWFRNSPVGGEADVWRTPVRGNYAWMGILHETGHALGLKHGHESPALSPNRDSVEFSIMTYRSYIGGDLNGYSNEDWGYPQTLMQYDIAALQRIYGANFSTNAGNSIYTWNPSTGEMSINGVPQGAPGGNRIFMTVWDGGGIDTYDLSNYASTGAEQTIDLRPGEWSRFGGGQIANLGDGHFARGNVANALLFENNPASLIENAIGGSEHDTFIANQAMNRFTGGLGFSDTFKWYSAADAGLGANADGVVDWKSFSDRIDLSAIDAKSGTAGDDSFTWIGTGAFTSHEGELRYVVEGNTIRLQGDIDGNGLSDFDIILNNTTSIDPFYIML